MYSYFFTRQALREIKKLEKEIQKRIIRKLDYFCSKDPLDFADFIIDSRLGSFRFRIGDYRVIFDKESEDSILILKVGHRKKIYSKR